MEFVYVFTLIFLSVFGLAVLIKTAAEAFLRGSVTASDVYIRASDDIADFVIFARKSAYIGRIYIVLTGTGADERAVALSEKYPDVLVVIGERNGD